MQSNRKNSFPAAALMLSLAVPVLQAADLTWDTLADDGASITAGSGVWDTVGANLVWNDGTDNVAWTQTNTTTPLNAAIFAGADGAVDDYTVALVSQMATQSLVFNSSGYRITGSIVYLGIPGTTPANGSITVAAGKTATISSVLGYIHNRAATVTVGSGGVLNLGGGTQGNNRPQLNLTGDGTINITAGTFQNTIGNRNAAIINQSGGTWTMTDQSANVSTSIGSNAGRDVNYTVTGTATLNVLASNNDAITYTLSLGRSMGDFKSTLTLQSGGTVNIGVTANRAGQLNLGSYDGNGDSLLDVQGGTLTVGTGKTTNKLYFFAAGANAGKTSTMTQSNGTVTANGIQFGANIGDTAGGVIGANTYAADASATLRLSGGNLYVGAQGITRGTAAADLPVTIQLQGGTLGASQNWSSPMDMKLGTVDGGLTIRAADSGGTARNISLLGDLANDDAVDGTLTKTGPGILTLAGTNTYTGATTVSAGEIKHSTAGSATTDITVATAAAHGVLVASGDSQWVNTGTLTHENDTDMHIDFGFASPSTTVAPMKVASLALGTGIWMRISGLVSGFLPGQTYPLVTWTGSGPTAATAFTSIILPDGISGTLGVIGNSLSLNVTGNTSLLNWNTGDGDWNLATPNWVDSSLVAASYVDGVRAVMFGDAAGVTGNPTVTLNEPFSPLVVLMNSTNHDYTISGLGTIAGSSGLVLDAANTRTLTLANAVNTFTGNTTIGGGTLRISGTGRLGNGNYAGVISIADGATLEYAGSGSQTLSGNVTGTGGALQLSADADLILTNADNSYGSLSIGNGRVFISTAGALPPAATVNVTGGLLVFGTGTSYANPVTVSSGGGIATRRPGGTSLTGTVTLPGTGIVIFNNDGSTTYGLSIASGQTLTGNLTVQVGGSRTNASPVGSVTLSGKLTGDGALTVASSGQAASPHFGTGVLILTGPNDYSGDTTVSVGTLRLSNAPDATNANPGNDASTVTIAETGATLDLIHTGTDKVDKLFIGTTQMPAGVYGPSATNLPQITGTGTLTVSSGPAGGFATWIAGTFANGTVPMDRRGPNDDYDNDGIPNLMEYAIAGLDPTVPNATIGSFTANTLGFTKREGANGISSAILESTDLGNADNWNEVTGDSYLNGPTTISFTLTPPMPPKNFLRLRVIQN